MFFRRKAVRLLFLVTLFRSLARCRAASFPAESFVLPVTRRNGGHSARRPDRLRLRYRPWLPCSSTVLQIPIWLIVRRFLVAAFFVIFHDVVEQLRIRHVLDRVMETREMGCCRLAHFGNRQGKEPAR